MRRPRLRLTLAVAIPLLIVVVLLAAWAIDSSGADGKVPRNVTLAGRDISKLPEDDLAITVADVAEEYATTEVEVRTDGPTYKATTADLGLRLDETATTAAALDLDGDQSLFMRPIAWLGSFLDERTAPLEFTLDEEQLAAGLEALGGNARPTEPSIVATADGFGIVSGTAGQSISSDGVAEQLLERATSGELPIVVDATVSIDEPTVTDEAATALADELTAGTADGLAVTAGDDAATIDAATTRTWLTSKIDGDQIVPVIDAEKTVADLTEALPETTEATDASFTVSGGAVQITPSTDGSACCGPDTSERVLLAVAAGTGAVDIDLEVTDAEFSTEEAMKLGITEPVGTTTQWNGQAQVKSFTTYYGCCVNRARNIQRMAELVRGTLVLPGERFSLNEAAGQRTEAKGFLPAGAIADGELVDQVGGGVSQFTTTMFNTVFFAGLPINEYQMHSAYFSRYPYGREATINWTSPDLDWTNNTPYGILVWTSTTETSVTVTLYSTQYAYGEQTGQSEGRSGNCTTVSTQRTITYVDGRTGSDSFNARYRDDGETSC